MNADAPRKRILPSFPDLVKELSQTSFAAKEDIERVAREVVTEELNRIKQGSSPRGMDALVGKAQRLLDPPPPPSGASILDDGDPFLETTGSHDLRGIWDRKTPLIGEESGTEILPAVPGLEPPAAPQGAALAAAAALPAPAIVAAPSGFGRAPLEADDSSVFGPLPEADAQRTSVLPPPQTPLPAPYAGPGTASGALPDFELDLPASPEPQTEPPALLERTLEEPLPVPSEPELQLGRLPEFAAQGPGDDTLSRLDFEAGNVDMKAAVNRYYTPPPFRTPAEGLRAAVAPPESFDEEVPPEETAGEPPGEARDLAATTAYEPAVAGLSPFPVGDSSVFGAPLAPLPADDDGVFGPAARDTGAAVAEPSPPYGASFDTGGEPELPPSPYGSSVQQPAAPLFSSLDPVAGGEGFGKAGADESPRAPEPRIAWASEEMERPREEPEERPRSSRPDGTTRLSGEVRHDETLVFAASQPTRRSPLFFVVVAAALIGGAYVAIRYVKPRMAPVKPVVTDQPVAETPVPAEPTPSTSAPPEPTVPEAAVATVPAVTSAALPAPTAAPTTAPPPPTATPMPTPKASTPTPSTPAAQLPGAAVAVPAPVPVPVSTRPLQPAQAGKARAQTMVSKDWAGKEPVFVIHFVSGKDRKIVEKEGIAIGKKLGLGASTIEVDLGEKGIWYRVVVGEFATVDEALAKHAELKAAETKGMGLVYRLAGN